MIWIAASLGGASALFVAWPGLARWLRWAGGLYLLYLGAQALWSAFAGGVGSRRSGFIPRSGGAAFRVGVLTNLGNPKSLAYYFSLRVATAAPSAPAWQKIAGGAGMAMISLGWYGLLAWTCSAPPVRRFYTRLRPFIAGVTGLIMIVFGGALLMVF